MYMHMYMYMCICILVHAYMHTAVCVRVSSKLLGSIGLNVCERRDAQGFDGTLDETEWHLADGLSDLEFYAAYGVDIGDSKNERKIWNCGTSREALNLMKHADKSCGSHPWATEDCYYQYKGDKMRQPETKMVPQLPKFTQGDLESGHKEINRLVENIVRAGGDTLEAKVGTSASPRPHPAALRPPE